MNENALGSSYQVFDTLPTSFVLTGQVQDTELQNFVNRFNELSTLRSNKERMPAKHCMKNIWIIKPAALNQGKGIELCRKLDIIIKMMRNKPSGSLWVVQKYIERPLLIAGRKFDLRVWVLVTGKRDLFFYRLGYVRTSSFEYDLEGRDNFVHLTNNCLQQYSDKYGIYEEGNTLSWEQLEMYLKEAFPQYEISFNEHFAPRIKDLVIDSYLSCRKVIEKGRKTGVFELLGYDFMIDEDFRVWLIEVNTNPYLGVPNKYISRILPNMLDDMLKLTLDIYFEPKTNSKRENLFELIYCEVGSLYSPKPVNKRQGFSVSFYPIQEFAQKQLCKQCIAYKYDEENRGQNFKDYLQVCKNILRNEGSVSTEEYSEFLQKIMSCVKNWKNFTEEQVFNSLDAFALFFSNSRHGLIYEKHSLKTILELFCDFSVDENIKERILSSISDLCKHILLKKLIAGMGLVHGLVENLLVCKSKTIKKTCKAQLVLLCKSPDKKIYVPGKSTDLKTFKEVIMLQGGLVALIHVALSSEKFIKKITEILNTHFSLGELNRQVMIIKDNKIELGEFPKTLLLTDLDKILIFLEGFISGKIQETTSKQNLIKKLKEEQEQRINEQEALIKKQEEEKQEKIKQYLRKKSLEIKKNKIKLENIEKIEKESGEKLLNERRRSLALKQSQTSLFLKRTNSVDKDLLKLQHAREKLNKNHRKKFLKEWKHLQNSLEKSLTRSTSKISLRREVTKAIHNLHSKAIQNTSESYEKLPTSFTNKVFPNTIRFPKFQLQTRKKISLLSKTFTNP